MWQSGRANKLGIGALRFYDDGHGVFTAAVLDGLARGDRNGNGTIEVTELADFVVDEVPRITKRKWNYEQFPQRHFDLKGPTFPVAGAK